MTSLRIRSSRVSGIPNTSVIKDENGVLFRVPKVFDLWAPGEGARIETHYKYYFILCAMPMLLVVKRVTFKEFRALVTKLRDWTKTLPDARRSVKGSGQVPVRHEKWETLMWLC